MKTNDLMEGFKIGDRVVCIPDQVKQILKKYEIKDNAKIVLFGICEIEDMYFENTDDEPIHYNEFFSVEPLSHPVEEIFIELSLEYFKYDGGHKQFFERFYLTISMLDFLECFSKFEEFEPNERIFSPSFDINEDIRFAIPDPKDVGAFKDSQDIEYCIAFHEDGEGSKLEWLDYQLVQPDSYRKALVSIKNLKHLKINDVLSDPNMLELVSKLEF